MDQQELQRLLEYCPETGIFTWRVKPAKQIAAGTEAGYQKNEYRYIRISGTLYYAHRLAVLYMTGKMPSEQVDHDNGIRGDNRWKNLKEANPTKNRRNAAKSKNNTSGTTGVIWDKAKQMWFARITVNYKEIFLGYFTDIDEAISVRKTAETTHGFNPNHGRTQHAQH